MEKTIQELEKEQNEFSELVKPIMKYLSEKHNPHCTIIITSVDAELSEGKMCHSTTEFLKD